MRLLLPFMNFVVWGRCASTLLPLQCFGEVTDCKYRATIQLFWVHLDIVITLYLGELEMQEDHEEKPTTMEEKLDYIDKEIRLLHKFCVDSGYSPSQIERYANPFLSPIKVQRHKKLRNRLFGLAAIVAVISALFYVDPAYRFLCVTGRQVSIKVSLGEKSYRLLLQFETFHYVKICQM